MRFFNSVIRLSRKNYARKTRIGTLTYEVVLIKYVIIYWLLYSVRQNEGPSRHFQISEETDSIIYVIKFNI